MDHVTRSETTDQIIQHDGRKRLVQRTATKCGKLFREGKITNRHMIAFDEVAKAAAEAMGAATEDWHSSTTRLISRYDGMPVETSQYGSRSLSVRVLDGERQVKWIRDRLPEEFTALFDDVLKEEMGVQMGLTLTGLGEQRGWYRSEKQQTAVGTALVCALLSMVAKLRREYLDTQPRMRVHPKTQREWPADLR